MIRSWTAAFIGMAGGLLCDSVASAQCLIGGFFAPQPQQYDTFGHDLAVDGQWMAIGAPTVTVGFQGGVGKVEMYRRDAVGAAWVHHSTVNMDPPSSLALFGELVDLHGDLLAVSAPGIDVPVTDAGAIFLFRYHPDSDQWLQEAKLTWPTVATSSPAGDVAIIGDDFVAVGDPYINTLGANSGAVMIFHRQPSSEWSLEATLMGDDENQNDYFGMQVASNGDELMVSALGASTPVSSVGGAAYVFRRDVKTNTWLQTQKITAGEPSTHFEFSLGLVVRDGIAAMSSKWYVPGQGAHVDVHVFRKDLATSVWQEEAVLSGTPVSSPSYGTIITEYVGLNADTVAVRDPGSTASAVKVFHQSSPGGPWQPTGTLVSPNPNTQFFAYSVHIADGWIYDGSFTHASGSLPYGPGQVFMFDANGVGPDCNGDGVCDETEILQGFSQDFNNNDVPDECEPPDVNGDGMVGIDDLFAVIDSWGPCPAPCSTDFDGNGVVNIDDLFFVINHWT